MLRPISSAVTLTLTPAQLETSLRSVFCRYNGFPMTTLDQHDEVTFVPVRGAEAQVGGFVRQPFAAVLLG